ncbi:MAG TPA: AraC family transcriptional regulator [Pseudomonas sp.]|nr:AraC family transcriptional regulator [Pseudomonadales bacterium]HCL40998.1 AraC family transcriptional regulator [Pseudomonas sp.]|tara:strand:- start:1474 stop:2532 length:1059 start_codon:yes stop_codon:yes gene_type:complete
MHPDTPCQAPDLRLISLQSTCLIACWLEEHHLPVEPVLEGSGLSLHELQTPARLITPEQEQQVFANTVTLTGDPAIGLKLGQRMRVSAYGQLGYAMLSAPTLFDALQVMLAFPVLLGSYFRLQLETLPDGQLALRADDYHASPALQPFNVELCLSSIKAMLDDALGSHLQLSAVHLSSKEPEHSVEYTRYFGDCPVVSDADAERLVFAPGTLNAALPLAEPVTHLEAKRYCQSVQDSFRPEPSPLVSQLSAQLEQQLESPPTLEQLALQLHCTTRTLRRHLQRSGCGYQQLLDRLRFQRAKLLLNSEQLPIYAIAEQLGFSETASFRHAFQRWSGTTPRAWRQSQQHHHAPL